MDLLKGEKIGQKSGSDKSLVLSGVFWNIVQLVINQSFAFIIKLVLAKLLFPEQFGLVGMATVFTGFVQVLNDLGIGAALVQRKDEDLREAHYHTAFWTGVLWSVGIFIIMCFGVAPLAAIFYKEELLRTIIPIMSLGILVSPVNLIHRAQLTKVMDFKKTTVIVNTSTIFSGLLSLALAFLGAGIWSLVFNSVAQIVIAMPMYFRATKWMPKFLWEKQAFKDVFGFGAYTTGTNIINYILTNLDYLLIGKFISATALGAYTLSFVLTDTFRSRLMSVINNVMYPFYGRKQDDPASIKKYYLKVVEYNSIIIYPIMVFFVSLGEPFIIGFFGAKWQESVIPLQILSVSVMFHMMVNSNTALIRGLGRPGLEMKLQIFKAILFIPMLIYGIHYYGTVGAAWSILINKVLAVIIAQYSFNYLLSIKVSTIDFLKAVRYPILSSVVAYIAAYFANKMGLHYAVSGVLLFIIYFICIWIFMREEIMIQVKQFKTIKLNKNAEKN